MIRIDQVFHGNVQGVGFRWRTRRVTGHYQVTGFVRNVPDGTVHLVLEGEIAEVRRCADEIHQELARHIDRIDERQLPATAEFLGFEVRR